MLSELKNKLVARRWLLDVAIIFLIAAALTAAAILVFFQIYQGKILPGVHAAGLDLSGQTREAAAALLNRRLDGLRQAGVDFIFDGRSTRILPAVAAPESDLAKEFVFFDVERAVDDAYARGRGRNIFQNVVQAGEAMIFKKDSPLPVTVDRTAVKAALVGHFSRFIAAPENARLTFVAKDDFFSEGEIRFAIEKEKAGRLVDYDAGLKEMERNFSFLKNPAVVLLSRETSAEITKADCLNAESRAEKIMAAAPASFFLAASTTGAGQAEGKEWPIKRNDLAFWLTLKINPQFTAASGVGQAEKIIVGLDRDRLKSYLEKTIAPAINQPATESKFIMANGKVAIFQKAKSGRELDVEATIKMAEERLVGEQNGRIELAVREIRSELAGEDGNDFGIEEIIGAGKSDFTGSPANRRHNIKVGAAAVNGTLIRPGEEFSLLKVLGKIEASTGYLPELVIKEGKTTPEFGGGLCQIGTTVFRGALASGLPITARRNHSYRVSYYEPAGTDATIYDPAPDFRFMNDTGHHVLIQSRLDKNALSFYFYGKKDGRSVKQTKPTIYNIVKPKPTRLIETIDLPAGQKKCTEKAHNGADAYFDYRVAYPNGEVKEKRFSSHYVPWQEVCLIGVEKLSEKEMAGEEKDKVENRPAGEAATDPAKEEIERPPPTSATSTS